MFTATNNRLWAEICLKYLILKNYRTSYDVPWNEAADNLHFVVILTDRIGDAFNSIYFLSNLRRLYPQARLTYIGCKFHDAEFHQRIIGQYVDQTLFKELLSERDFKKLNPDVIFDLNPVAELFPYYPSELALRIGHTPRCDIHVPQVDYNMKANDHLNILRIFGKKIELRYKPIVLPPQGDDRISITRPRKPYIALCLEATARSWMMTDEVIAALIEYLLALGKWDLFILGNNINESGYAYCGKSSRVHQCTGVLSLYQTMFILEGSEYVISMDTGLMHATSYIGKPLLAVFTCGEPHKNGPQGQRGATVLLNIHSDMPKVMEKEDRLQSFKEQAFLRLDHVIAGFNTLLTLEPTTVERRILETSTISYEKETQTALTIK